jgi:uncharacterized membrane protein
MNQRFPYIVCLLGAALWCGIIVLPVLAASMQLPFGSAAYKVCSLICHQDDARSLHLAGTKLAVCARCTAIYAGFLAGLLLSPWLSKRIRKNTLLWWAIAVAPMLLDVVPGLIGLHTITLDTRLITGGFFGLIAALILTPSARQGISELMMRLHLQRGNAYGPKTG